MVTIWNNGLIMNAIYSNNGNGLVMNEKLFTNVMKS